MVAAFNEHGISKLHSNIISSIWYTYIHSCSNLYNSLCEDYQSSAPFVTPSIIAIVARTACKCSLTHKVSVVTKQSEVPCIMKPFDTSNQNNFFKPQFSYMLQVHLKFQKTWQKLGWWGDKNYQWGLVL